jgi:predicted extracellular nuclease
LDGGAPPEVDAASQTDSGANSGDGDGGGSVDGDSGVDASTVTSATVEDVQQGSVTGQVTLTNVYVTAIDNVGASRGIWVADALAAAAWQGVFVATGATAPAVSVGETVSVTGTVSEFDLPGGGDTLTQITTTTDQVDGTTVISGNPTPVIVAPEVLADITNGEAYESVLVQIGPAKVTALNSGNRITVTDNGGHSLVVDDDLYAASPAINDCYSSITGVMTVNLADNERRLLPRGAVDLVIGSGCL